MTRNRIDELPYSEVEFTSPADQLINLIEQYYVRLYGEKPTRKEVLEMCNKVLENR